MSWAKIDDGFLDHPKAIEAGEDAANLYLRGLCYCAKHLTDGRIPKGALRLLTGKAKAADFAADLVRVGLWDDRGDGAWWVHDYLDWNDAAADVKANRERKAAYVKERRQHRKAAPAQEQGAPAVVPPRDDVPGTYPVRSDDVPGESPGTYRARTASNPIPTPTPSPSETPSPQKRKGATARRAVPPPPFSYLEALSALAPEGSRFLVPADGELDGGVVIAVRNRVRQFPDLATWRAVGDLIAVGDVPFPPDLNASWVASSRFCDAVTASRALLDRRAKWAAEKAATRGDAAPPRKPWSIADAHPALALLAGSAAKEGAL